MNMFQLAFCILRRPHDTFRILQKERESFSFVPVILLCALLVCVRIAFIYSVHYPLQDIRPRQANLIVEAAFLVLPLLMWAVANFAVTSIMDGETMMRESLTASLYCMVPYMVLMLPLALFSHALSNSGEGLYSLLQYAIYGWCGILFVMSIKVMNNYTALKTIGVIIINILVVALMLAIALLTIALVNQLWMFIEGLVREFSYTFRR